MSYRKNSELLSSFEFNDSIKSTKRVANNTLEITLSDGTTIFRFHNTNIITIKNGTIIYNSDGYRTNTTKDRINKFDPLNLRISQRDHQWYIGEHDFYDGITFNSNGELISDDKTIDRKKWNKAKKEISAFVKLIDDLESFPMPNAGDCWYCMLVTEKDKTPMGDASGDHSHLISHIKEGYMHGSLILNALRETGYQDMFIGAVFRGDTWLGNPKESVKRAVQKYLKKRLMNEDYYDFDAYYQE